MLRGNTPSVIWLSWLATLVTCISAQGSPPAVTMIYPPTRKSATNTLKIYFGAGETVT